jgi:hypothetical protein
MTINGVVELSQPHTIFLYCCHNLIQTWGPILENNGMLLSIEKKLICKESGMP